MKATKATKAVTKTRAFDVVNYLRTPAEQAAYLNAWLEDAPEDVAGFARALGDVARARGMTKVAHDAGLSRESLYKALSAKGNPSLATFLKVCFALDLSMHVDAMVLKSQSAAKAAFKDSAAQLRKIIRVTQRPRAPAAGIPTYTVARKRRGTLVGAK